MTIQELVALIAQLDDYIENFDGSPDLFVKVANALDDYLDLLREAA